MHQISLEQLQVSLMAFEDLTLLYLGNVIFLWLPIFLLIIFLLINLWGIKKELGLMVALPYI